ncbi:MAG TPA: hypothetical protein VLD67_11165, partial [Vicinamibacterales bacterium]|nr:hypothetical protein [Vicinamibacterales bacterium]
MKRISMTLLVMACVGMVSCGGSDREDPAGGAAAGGQRLRFAVIPKSLDLPVFNYARIGAERAAKELGTVEIIWN